MIHIVNVLRFLFKKLDNEMLKAQKNDLVRYYFREFFGLDYDTEINNEKMPAPSIEDRILSKYGKPFIVSGGGKITYLSDCDNLR